MACAKHFIANEQEHFRGGSVSSSKSASIIVCATDLILRRQQNPASSSNIEDRTMNELYLWPFAESVRAGVASVMCAYQEVNNTFSCENSASINGLLKGQASPNPLPIFALSPILFKLLICFSNRPKNAAQFSRIRCL
jgi:beta-glucosidase